MFRAAKAIQRGSSLARPRVSAQLSSIHFGGLGVSASDNSNNETASPNNYQINAHQLLRSVYGTRRYASCTITPSFAGGSRRSFSSSADNSNSSSENYHYEPSFSSSSDVGSSTTSGADPSVDSTLEKLFRENEALEGGAANPWVDAADALTSTGGLEFVPTWYNPADWCIRVVLQVQELTGVEMGMAICGTTLLARILLFPVVASGQKAASRMAHLSPELKALQKRYENVRNASVETKAKMGEEVGALFKRYETNPFKAMTAPLVQLPFMMGMFFGLKKMPDYFPQEFATGGMYWMTDLTVPDPTYILPGICFVTFVGTVELGKEQMAATSPENAATMLVVMRGMSVLMFYICTTFHGGLVLYFTVTNIFTVFQIGLLKVPAVKNFFGIWEPPKAVPGAAGGEGFFAQGKKLMDQATGKVVTEEKKMQQHNEMVENQKKIKDLSKRRRDRRRRATKSNAKKRGSVE